ncbi:MAG: hypothetical protein KKD63_06475 [Proteobacteria bacterium]|nr:hypothetical protein [Desulfobulbaceae bacterium]MBU4152507.1 hypothetical protein [Pseudomonadota bacterium]
MTFIKILHLSPLIITSGFFLSACSFQSLPPSSPGSLKVKITPAMDVKITQTSARQDESNVIISGYIQRNQVHGRLIPKGHIDISIIDDQGDTIHQTSTKYSPEILPRIHGMKSVFHAQIPKSTPQGSLVVVKFHRGPHND